MRPQYTIFYQPIEDVWIMATVPELPGAVTQGRTRAEARAMIKEAIALLVQSYCENAAKDATIVHSRLIPRYGDDADNRGRI